MTIEEVLLAFLRSVRDAGEWRPGDRFWIQVRGYEAGSVNLRFFNHETGRRFDGRFPLDPA